MTVTSICPSSLAPAEHRQQPQPERRGLSLVPLSYAREVYIESIATIMPRSMNGALKKTRSTLGELIAALEEQESYENADVVVPTRAPEFVRLDS